MNYPVFNIGDTVRLVMDHEGFMAGTVGVVTATDNDPRPNWILYTVKTKDGRTIPRSFGFRFELVSNNNSELHITVKGNETIAVYKHDGKVEKAVAKCSPEDTFDFKVGAKIAMERLGILPADPVEDKAVKLISSFNSNYGVCGTKTNYKDVYGNPLFVGDVVEQFHDNNYYGDAAIVSQEDEPFVMGIRVDCNSKTGKTKNWTLIKKKSYSDMKPGDKIGLIKYE